METASVAYLVMMSLLIAVLLIIVIRVNRGARDAEKRCEEAVRRLEEEKHKLMNLKFDKRLHKLRRCVKHLAHPSGTFFDKDMVDVYTRGPLSCSVCTCLEPEEMLKVVNIIHPSGTEMGWMVSEDETFASGEPNPCPCERKPETHKHYFLKC